MSFHLHRPIRRCFRRALVFAAAGGAALGAADAKDHAISSLQDFDTAIAAAAPGDALVLRRGVWRDAKLRFSAQGAADAPITLRAETPGETVFEGASELVIDGEHLVVSGLKFQGNAHVTSIVTPYKVTVASVVTFTARANHCRLTETAVVDSGEGVTTFVHLEPGNRRNRVDHCWFSNQGAIGVTFYLQVDPAQPNEHLIDHNYFGDRRPGEGNRWETVRIGHSEQQAFVSSATVSHNYFYRCNGEIECVSNKSTGNRYLYNAFVETRGQLTLRHGDRAWVEGNYFFGGDEPRAQGVRVIGSDHVVINNYFKRLRDAVIVYSGEVDPEPRGYAPVVNALIAFNTLEACVNNFTLAASGRPVPPRDLRIVGNLVQAPPGAGPIIDLRSDKADVRFFGNVMSGAPLGIPRPPGIDVEAPALRTDEWQRVLADPDRVHGQLASGDFPQVRQDLNGAPRSGPASVGAIGAVSARPLYPLDRYDVGPSWMKPRALAGSATDSRVAERRD